MFDRVPYCFLFRWSRFHIPVQKPVIIFFGFSKQTQRYSSNITPINIPSFCMTTFSASLTHLTSSYYSHMTAAAT